jgi:hypothetical protein
MYIELLGPIGGTKTVKSCVLMKDLRGGEGNLYFTHIFDILSIYHTRPHFSDSVFRFMKLGSSPFIVADMPGHHDATQLKMPRHATTTRQDPAAARMAATSSAAQREQTQVCKQQPIEATVINDEKATVAITKTLGRSCLDSDARSIRCSYMLRSVGRSVRHGRWGVCPECRQGVERICRAITKQVQRSDAKIKVDVMHTGNECTE